ncbi:MAG: ion channel [Nocardioides sp.]|uniref:ion channel n=1 Tax=Nocardioides sp. TaxID=35761 RepID=UPI0039E46451
MPQPSPAPAHRLRRAAYAVRTHPNANLLAAQLALVLGYPFLDGTTAGRAILGVVQTAVIVTAVLSVRMTPIVTWVVTVLALPCTVLAIWESLAPATAWVAIASAAVHVPFYLLVSYGLIRYLFHDEVVTRDELFATAAAFTVVAWGFAYAYSGIQAIWPGSFGTHQAWFELLFMSFTCLTSVGLADFSPVLAHARSVVILEQVAGVFYVALVVSRLVGLTLTRANRS